MAGIFDPVVRQVTNLISQQVQSANIINEREKVSVYPHSLQALGAKDSHSQKIILVGGFGESKYLAKKVGEWTKSQPYPIQVKNPQSS
jgi:hypothetical protein